MSRMAKVLRLVAFTVMAALGLLGSAFFVGETATDPGGSTAVVAITAWLVPLVLLVLVAVRRPTRAERVLVVVAVLAALLTLGDSAFGIIPRDDVGPVAAVVVFSVGTALAFLGLRRPMAAGLLLVLIGIAQLAAASLISAQHTVGGGPSLRAALGSSSGVVILPILLAGLLFLLAGSLERRLGMKMPEHRFPASTSCEGARGSASGRVIRWRKDPSRSGLGEGRRAEHHDADVAIRRFLPWRSRQPQRPGGQR